LTFPRPVQPELPVWLTTSGSLVGLLVLIACGIYTMIHRETLGRGDWAIDLPGTDYALFLMFHVRYIAPMVLLLLACLVAWRVINWPVFADFLIATEAELNKVSWSTRKRLVQDTIVVLVTVILLTIFLFFIDLLWGWLLSSPYIGVLQVEKNKDSAEKKEVTPW